MLRIIIQEKGGNRQEIQTDKAEFTIGRVPINDLALPKNNVSKRHAKIARTDSGWELIDLGSTNGTFVNGDQVKQHRITPTDQVIIGDFLLQFEMLDGSQPPPVPGGPGAPPPMGGPGAPPPMGGPGAPPPMGGPGAPPPMGGPGAPPPMGGPGAPPPMGGPGAPPPMGGPGAPPPMGGPGAPPSMPPGPPGMGGPGGPPSMGGPGAPPPMGGPGNMPPGPPSMGGMLPMSGPNTPPPKPPGPPGMGGPGGPPSMGGPGAPPPMGGPGAPPPMGGPGAPPPMGGPGAPPPMGGPGAMPPIPPGPPGSGVVEESALANEPSSPDMPPMPPGLQGDNVESSSGDEVLGLDDPSLLEVPDLPDDPDGDDGTPTPPEGLPASMEVPPDEIDQDEPVVEESPSEALPEELPVEEFRLEESEQEQAETSDPAGQEDEVELALNGLEMGEEELPAEELPAEELPAQALPAEEPPADEVVIEESIEVVEEEIVEDVEEKVEAPTEPPRQVNEQLKNALAPNKQSEQKPEQKPVESIPIPKPPPARTPAPPQKPKKVRRAAASVQLTPPDMDKKLAFAEAMRTVRTELLTKMQELRDVEPVHVDDMLRSDATKQARRIASKLQRVKKLTDAFSPEEIGKAVVQELTGYGPLDDLLAQAVERIVINGCYQISVERQGVLEPVEGLFSGENALKDTLGHLVAKAGHQLKDMPATFELRLPDGLWMHVIMSPLSRRGTVVTLRPSRSATWTLEQLLEEEVIDGRIATFLASCVENRRNIVVSGARGSGRSSLLNALGMRIPENERVVSVEEVGELELPHPLWIGLETTSLSPGTYPSDVEELLEHALRTQPGWLLMGDTSGRGLGTLLQRMAAGLEGVMLLGQAHSAGQLLGKLTLLGGFQLDGMLYSQQTQKQFVEGVLAEAVDIVVQTEEFVCGTRKVTGIFELYNGIDNAQLRPLFFFEREGVDEDGVVQGRFKATGEQPAFYDQLEARGVAVERSIFDA